MSSTPTDSTTTKKRVTTPPAAVAEARALRIALKPLMDHGLGIRLEGPLRRLDFPRTERDLAEWLAENSPYRVSLRLGWPSKMVAVVRFEGVHAGQTDLPLDGALSFVPSDGFAPRCYLYSTPSSVAVFGAASLDRNFRVLAENETICLPASRAEWNVLVTVPAPPLSEAELRRLGCRVVQVDGTVRFRELGRSGAAYPYWETEDEVGNSGIADAWNDATASVCCYVAPDHQSIHVCDLLIESDHEGDDALARSLGDTKLVVRRLIEFGVPVPAITITYTGNKSLHVHVSCSAFGQLPGPENNEVMKRVAERLFGGRVDFDRTLFNRRQKSRLVGTRHGSTELFALCLSMLASWRPSQRPPGPRVDTRVTAVEPVPALCALWKEEREGHGAANDAGTSGPTRPRAADVRTGREKRVAADRKAAQRAASKLTGHPTCIRALLSGQVTPSVSRNILGVALVSYARTRRLGDLDRRRLYKEAAARIPSKELRAAQRERRLNDADHSAARCKDDTYVFGPRSCQVLRDAGLPCTEACPLRALWKRRPLPGVRYPEPLSPGIEVPAVPGLPAGVRLEDVRDEVRRRIDETVFAPQLGGSAVLIEAPPSIGKTFIGTRRVAGRIATEPGGFRVLWAAARHELLDVVAEGIPGLEHVKRRSAENCMRSEEIKAIESAGWGGLASRWICGSCPHHPRRANGNPCEYQRVLRDRTASWGVVHELLSLTDIASSFDFVVLDEDVVQSCIREQKYRPCDLERAATGLVAVSPATSAALKRALDSLAQVELGAKKVGRRALREALKGIDVQRFATDVDAIDWNEVKPAWTAKLEEAVDERDSDGLTRVRRRRLPPNPKPLLLAVRDLLLGKAAAVQWTGSAWRVKWLEPVRLGNRPVLVLDATAEPALLERVLGRKVEVHEFDVPFTAPVLQVVDGKYPRSSFFDRGDGTPFLRPRILKRMSRLVAERARRVTGRTLLATFKRLVDDPAFGRERATLPDTVDVAWYGNLRGMDHSTYSQIILVGFPYAPPDELVFMAEAIYQGEEVVSEETTEQLVPYIATNDWASPADNPIGHKGGPLGLRMRRFMDPRVEQVRRLAEDAEYYQALNRIRQLNDPSKVSVLMTSVPLDPAYGVPVRLVHLDQLMGQKEDGEGNNGNTLRQVLQAFLQDQGFVAAWAVAPANPGIGNSTLQREVRRLARERGLPRLSLSRRTGRGGDRVAYGDIDRCRRYDGVDAYLVTETPNGGRVQAHSRSTPRNPDANVHFSRAVEGVTYTRGEKKSRSQSS
jgi:hypothetical protein